jgi:hypothetical protein
VRRDLAVVWALGIGGIATILVGHSLTGPLISGADMIGAVLLLIAAWRMDRLR